MKAEAIRNHVSQGNRLNLPPHNSKFEEELQNLIRLEFISLVQIENHISLEKGRQPFCTLTCTTKQTILGARLFTTPNIFPNLLYVDPT